MHPIWVKAVSFGFQTVSNLEVYFAPITSCNFFDNTTAVAFPTFNRCNHLLVRSEISAFGKGKQRKYVGRKTEITEKPSNNSRSLRFINTR
jgi:hypothetical protein